MSLGSWNTLGTYGKEVSARVRLSLNHPSVIVASESTVPTIKSAVVINLPHPQIQSQSSFVITDLEAEIRVSLMHPSITGKVLNYIGSYVRVTPIPVITSTIGLSITGSAYITPQAPIYTGVAYNISSAPIYKGTTPTYPKTIVVSTPTNSKTIIGTTNGNS